jgi:DNA-binding NarL/FixJ family response regulator
MDINLAGMTGIECARRLKEHLPDLLIIMLTIFDDSERVFAALRAGASGYLLKRFAPNELITSIQQVMEGGSPMSPHIARRVVEFFYPQRSGRTATEMDYLTDRERELLALLARGKHYKEIADQLGISTDTVRSHIRRIYRKLHVHSRTEAAVKFLGRQQP